MDKDVKTLIGVVVVVAIAVIIILSGGNSGSSSGLLEPSSTSQMESIIEESAQTLESYISELRSASRQGIAAMPSQQQAARDRAELFKQYGAEIQSHREELASLEVPQEYQEAKNKYVEALSLFADSARLATEASRNSNNPAILSRATSKMDQAATKQKTALRMLGYNV